MTFALQVLIASSIFCVVIIALLLVQKSGYLRHKIFTILMLLSSMLFLIAASAYFYYEYPSYLDRKERYGTVFKVDKIDEYKFTALEIDVLEEFSEAKNKLIGYEQFLKESARNYNSEDFSYGSLIEEEIVSQMERKEYDLSYWKEIDTIINSIYTGKNPYAISRDDSYYPINIVPSTSGFYNAFQSEENREFSNLEDTEYKAKVLYIQRYIKNFDRSSESIKDLWEQNKMFIYTIVSKSRYNIISKMIDDLITIYDRIIQEPNYLDFYEKQNIYTDTTQYAYEYDNQVFLRYPNKEFVDSFEDYWGFGFWDRRFEEENDQAVYKILKEIQAHYND